MDPELDDLQRHKRFGDALAEALRRSNCTQKQLAAALRVDQTAVSAWKRGTKLGRMSRGRVARIERTLGVDDGSLTAELFGPSSQPPPPTESSDRLAVIERQQAEMLSKIDELTEALLEATRRLRDQGT